MIKSQIPNKFHCSDVLITKTLICQHYFENLSYWALTVTLVQNRFFTTESQRTQRDNFYLAGRYRQIKSLLSLQNRDPTLCQSPVRRLRFYSRREGIYDPIAASRLDHNKSSSVYSVPPWWTWFQKGRISFQKPNEINVTPLVFELIWTAMIDHWVLTIDYFHHLIKLLPQVRPPPNAVRTIRSPFWIDPFRTASSKAIGTVADEMLPYFSIVR